MSFQPGLDVLIDYAAWVRGSWFDWLFRYGDSVLAIDAGPNGDGRFHTIGEIIRHIFSAETRYADRLSNRPVTETSSVPADKIDALIGFGRNSRRALKNVITTLPEDEWDIASEYKIGNLTVRATPQKIVTHVLMHEIRHWAQIGTLLRLNGLAVERHDFLFSPVMDASD